MPNHCENKIEITGEHKDLVTFWNGIKRFKGHDVSPCGEMSILKSYLPMPSELRNTRAFSEAENTWYDWALKNWGSKWGDYDTDFEMDEDSGEISGIFLSAWGPCNEGILNLSKMFPLLTFVVRYREPGMSFMGKQVCRGGEEIEEWSREMQSDDDGSDWYD